MLVISKKNFMTVAFGAIVVMLYAFFLFLQAPLLRKILQ